ncbi:MAG TPA: hypothetical protein VHN58_09585 [Croceicoccus sp.]|nr:hypothetical protein [Croceicoccus sp.]
MKHSGSARVILGTALVALSIMAAKTAVPAIPIQTTVLASTIGLVLIFLLFRSDARRRRELAARMKAAAMPDVTDPDTIRRRLEDRPLPQFSVATGPHGPSGISPAAPHRAPMAATPVLELVEEVGTVLDLTRAMELNEQPAAIARPAN